MYNLKYNKVLCHSKFASGGSALAWAPLSMDPAGITLLTGYSDGVLR